MHGKALATALPLTSKLWRKDWAEGTSHYFFFYSLVDRLFPDSYASIGAVLMSQRVANGIRDRNGFWQHGHTYQVGPFLYY